MLSNAIEYSSESDRVIFDLVCQAKQAIFRIGDFGIGIALEEQTQLFDSFHRANNVGSIPGRGLGRSIYIGELLLPKVSWDRVQCLPLLFLLTLNNNQVTG